MKVTLLELILTHSFCLNANYHFRSVYNNLLKKNALKPYKNRKCSKRNFILVFRTYIWINALHINAHNTQNCPGIEPDLEYSAAGLKQSDVTIRPKNHRSICKNEIYIGRRANFVTTDMKIMKKL